MSLDPSTENQIRQWFTAGSIDPILSLIDSLKSQRDRAELSVRAFEHHIKELQARTKAILAPMLEKEPTIAQSSEPQTKLIKPSKPIKSAPSINLTNLI